MPRVIVVHGINNTYLGSEQLKGLLLPALSDGVALASRQNEILEANNVDFVFYGDLFRRPGRFLGEELPYLDAGDVDDGSELDLLLEWWRAASKVDPSVVPPSERTLGFRSSARAAILALSSSRFLAQVSERMLVWWLKQVTAYFTSDQIRSDIQDRFASAVTCDTSVVVAHSLGSVIAYEGLCGLTGHSITDLITLGSPLGVRNIVFDRLRPTPATSPDGSLLGVWPRTARWVNVVDVADFVAVQPRLRGYFGERVVDVAIDNGLAAHKLQRYLSAPETGAAVLAGLQEGAGT